MSDIDSESKIQSLNLQLLLDTAPSIEEILNEREKNVDPDTELIEKKSVIKKREREQQKLKRLEHLRELAKKYGMLNKEKESSNIKGSIMKEVSSNSEPKSMSVAMLEVQKKESEQLLENLKQEKLNSMSLLDSSANELNLVLKEICKKKENNEFQRMSLCDVEAAVKVAGGIESLIRAKTDSMRGVADVLKAIIEIKGLEKN